MYKCIIYIQNSCKKFTKCIVNLQNICIINLHWLPPSSDDI